jgi:mannose-6-phosphate isomerase-like protein (cupin superfamily)
MPYLLKRKLAYTQKGLKGYKFPLKNKKLEVYFVDVKKGHDDFIISKKITHIYYILEGKGYFTIGNKKYNVKPGVVIEVPPDIEYCYSGKMRILMVMVPPWFKGNEKIIKKNPDVFSKSK